MPRIDKNEDDLKYKLKIMKALGWYLEINKKKHTRTDIAKHASMDKSVLSRLTIAPQNADEFNIQNLETHKKFISYQTAEDICRAMDTTLENILFLYQYKNALTDSTKIDEINHIASLLKLANEKEEYADLENEEKVKKICNQIAPPGKNNLITDVNNPLFQKWIGNYYCYFSSTNSDEAGRARGSCAVDEENPKLKGKMELLPSDFIFCGEMNISGNEEDNLCHVNFEFLSNPEKGTVKVYNGVLSLSKNTKAVFGELFGFELGEKTYFITEQQDIGADHNHVQFCCAMVLTFSSGMNHRRPCCERMIISSEPIKENTALYEYMKANLHMNDNFIRITEWGYEQLLKEIDESDDPEMKAIAAHYSNFQELQGNTVKIEPCAFIPEDWVYVLNNLSKSQKIKFETLLRNHSIASWYYKTKGTKAVDLYRLSKKL
ncbi:MAG: hypothetical protein K6F51_15005 [Acetatifactor sp.]|nr:hypothetical protein [Acetatifactor sp.]